MNSKEADCHIVAIDAIYNERTKALQTETRSKLINWKILFLTLHFLKRVLMLLVLATLLPLDI